MMAIQDVINKLRLIVSRGLCRLQDRETIGQAADELDRLRGLSLCSSCPTDEPDRPYNAIICHQCAKGSYDEQEAEIDRLRAIVDPIEKLLSEPWRLLSIGRRVDSSIMVIVSSQDGDQGSVTGNTLEEALAEALEAAVKAKREVEKGGD